MGLFSRINKGLKKTRDNMSGAINAALYGKNEIDDDFYEELEEILVMADVGVNTATEIVEKLRDAVFKKNLRKAKDVKKEIRDICAELLSGGEELDMITVPSVILVIGVNGVGKTTTIGKLAHIYKENGKSVLLAAADTFRAAAIDQLEIWGQRGGIEVIKHEENSDPAAV
ncbi:MAG: signal recognition particle receptor subunit alpha, partial [Clostridia bacterium]|nr:signal recognition particle receptor subunit alpha [Clostridia bacterium]